MSQSAVDVFAAKQALRHRLGAQRAALDLAWVRVQSAAIQARVLAMAEVRAASCVAMYVAFGREIQTGALLATFRERGCRVCVPAQTPEGGGYRFVDVAPDEAFSRGPLGIPQPIDLRVVAPQAIDVAIVPGLAFDASGGRLGHGAGHYDRLLGGAPHLVCVGVAYAFQLVPEVPQAGHDIRMQAVVTESVTIRVVGAPDGAERP